MGKTKELINDGYRCVSNKTVAKKSSVYMENGDSVIEEVFPMGNPEYVKKELMPKRSGETVECEFAHNWQVWEKEVHQNTPNGIVKGRKIKFVQAYDLGDGGSPSDSPTNKNYNSGTSLKNTENEDNEEPQNPSEPKGNWAFLKVKEHGDQLLQHNGWLFVLGIGLGVAIVLGAAALALG